MQRVIFSKRLPRKIKLLRKDWWTCLCEFFFERVRGILMRKWEGGGILKGKFCGMMGGGAYLWEFCKARKMFNFNLIYILHGTLKQQYKLDFSICLSKVIQIMGKKKLDKSIEVKWWRIRAILKTNSINVLNIFFFKRIFIKNFCYHFDAFSSLETIKLSVQGVSIIQSF